SFPLAELLFPPRQSWGEACSPDHAESHSAPPLKRATRRWSLASSTRRRYGSGEHASPQLRRSRLLLRLQGPKRSGWLLQGQGHAWGVGGEGVRAPWARIFWGASPKHPSIISWLARVEVLNATQRGPGSAHPLLAHPCPTGD